MSFKIDIMKIQALSDMIFDSTIDYLAISKG